MDFYIARHPIFNRRKEIFGYKLQLCRSLRDRFYEMYREPDDAEALYRQLCFSPLDDTPVKPLAILDFSEELFESLIPLLPRNYLIVEYSSTDNSELTVLKDLKMIKAQGYKVLYNAAASVRPDILPLVDFVRMDFQSMSLESQFEAVKPIKGKNPFIADGINAWEDFKKALVIGYDYFQGYYFMQPMAGKQSSLRSFGTSILRIMAELGSPEPSFKELTSLIEHDLNLSYSLLKLCNSAYIAPRFKVKTISQALTILGLRELSEFMSTIIMRQMKSPENNELLRRSLIRGKLMDLLAGSGNIQQKGTEAFFVGIFSLIDVILGRSMAEIMEELPLTDSVKGALLGQRGDLKALLDMVRLYEQGCWEEFDLMYALDPTEQEKLMNSYLQALKWAESFDF